MTDFRHEVVIDAPAAIVYRHLTTAAGLLCWIAAEAQADPTPGGELRWTHHNGATMLGRYVEVVPDQRIVFRYGWEGDLMGVPPESTLVEIDLTEHHGRTTVVLHHHGLPDTAVDDHRHGWQHFLSELAAVVAR